MFRISRGDSGFDSDTLDRVREMLRNGKPGRFHVDEIRADPLPSDHTSRRWGVGIKRADRSVDLEPDPWPSRPNLTSITNAVSECRSEPAIPGHDPRDRAIYLPPELTL
jgi:hypothetical protein